MFIFQNLEAPPFYSPTNITPPSFISTFLPPDGTIDYKLIDLGMFFSCESTTNFYSDNDSGIDSFSHSTFLRNPKQLMASNNPKNEDIESFETHYICEEKVSSFRRHIILFGTGDESN